MRDRLVIIFLLLIVVFTSIPTVYASETLDIIETLDWSQIENFFNSLPDNVKILFDGDIKNFMSEFTENTGRLKVESFNIYTLNYLLNSFKKHLSLFAIILLTIVLTSFFKSIKPNFASNSIGRIVDFSVALIIGSLLTNSVLTFINSISSLIKTITTLVQVAFPLIFTLLTTIGATISSASFQLSLSIFVNFISVIIASIALPITLLTLILSIVSTIKNSSSQNLSFAFINFAKKAISSIFFVFSAFLALQGISVSVKDSVGVRLAKFSLNKYVPIIGGYLSDGFNYLFAGSVLLKNSIGISFIVLLLVLALPILIEILTFHVLLKITAGVGIAMSENRVSQMLVGISKCTSLMLTCIIGIIVCLIILTSVVILSCNTVL